MMIIIIYIYIIILAIFCLVVSCAPILLMFCTGLCWIYFHSYRVTLRRPGKKNGKRLAQAHSPQHCDDKFLPDSLRKSDRLGSRCVVVARLERFAMWEGNRWQQWVDSNCRSLNVANNGSIWKNVHFCKYICLGLSTERRVIFVTPI